VKWGTSKGKEKAKFRERRENENTERGGNGERENRITMTSKRQIEVKANGGQKSPDSGGRRDQTRQQKGRGPSRATIA